MPRCEPAFSNSTDNTCAEGRQSWPDHIQRPTLGATGVTDGVGICGIAVMCGFPGTPWAVRNLKLSTVNSVELALNAAEAAPNSAKPALDLVEPASGSVEPAPIQRASQS